MNKIQLNIEIELTQPILGSLPGNKEIYGDFIASKAETVENTKEELSCVSESMEKATTFFPKDEKGIFLWDYQFKGFLKEAIGVMAECGDIALSKWTFKRAVDSTIFVSPRRIYLLNPQGGNYKDSEDFCERPLRAETMQGDRIALARSQRLPEGTKAKLSITLLESTNTKSKFSALTEDKIKDALNYGELKGLGQWRSSGCGSFTWKEAK